MDGKKFTIELDTAPGHVYTNGDLITGKVLLCSSSDEEVAGVLVEFAGSAESQVGIIAGDQQGGFLNTWARGTFFQSRQLLYRGNYKLRKDVPYGWPFQLQIPPSTSLPPSGKTGYFLLSQGKCMVEYKIRALRTASPEQAAILSQPGSSHASAEVKETIKHPLRSMVKSAEAEIKYMPSRPDFIDPCFTTNREYEKLPLPSENDGDEDRSRSGRSVLSSIFHRTPKAGCTISLDLPKNIIRGEPIQSFLRIESDDPAGTPAPVLLRSYTLDLCSRVRNSSGVYVSENDLTDRIFTLRNPDMVISDNEKHEIVGPYEGSDSILPSFDHSVLSVYHVLKAHVTLDSEGKKITWDLPVMNVTHFSTHTKTSPLKQDFICRISSSVPLSPHAGPGSSQSKSGEEDIASAFLALSRTLRANGIRHRPCETGDSSSIMALHLSAGPKRESRSTTVFETPHGSFPISNDRILLSQLMEGSSKFQPLTSGIAAPGVLSYSWGDFVPDLKRPALRVEFSDPTPEPSVPPPPYEKSSSAADEAVAQATTLLSNAHLSSTSGLTLSHIFNLLLQSVAPESASSSPQTGLPPVIADVVYLCQVFGDDLQAHKTSISLAAAREAVASCPDLRRSLVHLVGLASDDLGPEPGVQEKKLLTKKEAFAERQNALLTKDGPWSNRAKKREQVFAGN
ncbi:MAG: hypothetical protein M1818_004023 [Claussenomyces sp. TS43310]|nr:MAG: hypothetical protein M1818_004023 [Claussenomyces sp. TS43310]